VQQLIRDLLAPLTAVMREAAWSMPLGQGLHLLGISLLLGCAVLLYPRLIGSQAGDTAAIRFARLAPVMWLALVLIALTGVALFIAEPVRMMRSPVFVTKMGLVVAAIACTLGLRQQIRNRSPTGKQLAASVRILAAMSLGLWFAIAASGRLIGYWRRLIEHFFG